MGSITLQTRSLVLALLTFWMLLHLIISPPLSITLLEWRLCNVLVRLNRHWGWLICHLKVMKVEIILGRECANKASRNGTVMIPSEIAPSILISLAHTNKDRLDVLPPQFLETTENCFRSTGHGFPFCDVIMNIAKSGLIHVGADFTFCRLRWSWWLYFVESRSFRSAAKNLYWPLFGCVKSNPFLPYIRKTRWYERLLLTMSIVFKTVCV